MTIQPNELNLSVLPFVEFSKRNLLPSISAVYFAVSDQDNVLYIGKSQRLNKRWATHNHIERLKQLNCTRIAWIESPVESITSIERVMIRFYQPPLNQVWVNGGEDNPKCPCGGDTRKAGETKAGSQRYRCIVCGKNHTEGDRIWGTLPKYGKPMSAAERMRRSRERKKEQRREEKAE